MSEQASDHRVPECKCPYCGHMLSAAGVLTHETPPPVPGDFSVCIACGGICRFTKNRRLRKASLDEAGNDQQLVWVLVKTQETIRHFKATRPDWCEGPQSSGG